MAKIYIEGGGEGKDQWSKCREGFQKLFQATGELQGRMPRLVPCGGREQAFKDFKKTLKLGGNEFVAMLIDSEDPIAANATPWQHLKTRDGWEQPDGATDEQVLFMTTCMETWIVADRVALKAHYGANLQEHALPALTQTKEPKRSEKDYVNTDLPIATILEQRSRNDIQNALIHATRNCINTYKKGDRSFAILAELSFERIKLHVPNFKRTINILKKKLK
jgi:hypothetical protein